MKAGHSTYSFGEMNLVRSEGMVGLFVLRQSFRSFEKIEFRKSYVTRRSQSLLRCGVMWLALLPGHLRSYVPSLTDDGSTEKSRRDVLFDRLDQYRSEVRIQESEHWKSFPYTCVLDAQYCGSCR